VVSWGWGWGWWDVGYFVGWGWRWWVGIEGLSFEVWGNGKLSSF